MEGSRCVDFFLEKTEGRSAVLSDQSACSQLAQAVYDLGIVHRDLHTENFIVTGTRAYLIDFETCSDKDGYPSEQRKIMY